MKRLLILVILLVLCLPVAAQDEPAAEVTNQTVEIVATSPAVEAETGSEIDINIGGQATTNETPETPVEPMPWWALVGIEIGKLVTLYLTVLTAARAAVTAFMSRPSSIAAAENAVNLVRAVTPDALEEAAQKGAEKAVIATRELVDDLRRALLEVTDNVPYADKQKPQTPPQSPTLP